MIYNIVKERVVPILILKIGSVGGEGQGEIHFDGLTKYSGTLVLFLVGGCKLSSNGQSFFSILNF